ncbi:hypothetical protein LTR85_007505 [Meristemomyces frigidus]|nr:hypothetical protein LTR85_007505 [Meristemomyces frigidus]
MTGPPCRLLDLPSELRISIYEYVLGFSRPLKLRQTVAGSENTTLLRTNKQIYREALPILFDINTIAVTRNDFCRKTDVSLKTPVASQHIQHLLVTNFGASIACNFLLDRCDVCQPSALGLLGAVNAMPQLKDVVVDYSKHVSNLKSFRKTRVALEPQSMTYTGVGRFALHDEALNKVDFTFQNVPLARIWEALVALSSEMQSDGDVGREEKVLVELRKIDADVPDKLWLIVWGRRYPALNQWPAVPDFLRDTQRPLSSLWMQILYIYHLWTEVERQPGWLGICAALTESLEDFLTHETAPQCRRFLRVLREHADGLG